ncbi:MAG: hypothetical protein P8L85_01775 [Rubripirellula sp.]|nr:hypothetical protein [Rubripirellula sp.]
MDAKKELETRFQKDLVAALNASKADFNFSQFVDTCDVSRETADAVAAKLLATVFVKSLKDHVITDKEEAHTNKIARRLEISSSRQKEILNRAGKAKYRAELAAAEADGVITDEERDALNTLLGTLLDSDGDAPQTVAPQKDSVTHSTSQKNKTQPHVSTAIGAAAATTAVAPAPSASFDEAKFRKTLVYQSKGTVKSLLADLNFLRHFDKHNEKRSQIFRIVGYTGIACLCLAAVCLLFVLGTPRGSQAAKTAVIAVGGIGAILSITGFAMNAKHSNLEDRRYEILHGLLKLLDKDMADEAHIEAKIDFRPHNHSQKLLRKGKVSYWNVKFYMDRWLEVRGNFVDGTKYTITLIEKQQDRHRTKRSASGKLKHKYKTKNSSEAIVNLKIKQKRYPQARNKYNHIKNAIKLPSWVNLKSVTADGDQLTLRTTTSSKWDAVGPKTKRPAKDGVNWMAMMFLSMYRLLNVSK